MVEAWRSTDRTFDPSIVPTLIESGYRASIDDPTRVAFLPDGRLVADSYVTFDPIDLLVPFASARRPVPIAIGVVAMWRCS